MPIEIYVADASDGALVGFVEVDLRSHADGCNPSKPMGYIEGWYVEGACVNYARAVRADALINAAGETIEEPILDKEGAVVGTKVKKNPAVEVANAAWRHVRGFCSDFGFSPASRMRISLEKPDTNEEDLMKLLLSPRLPRENRTKL